MNELQIKITLENGDGIKHYLPKLDVSNLTSEKDIEIVKTILLAIAKFDNIIQS